MTNVDLKNECPNDAKHVLPAVPSSEVYLEDCVKALKRYADNHFDLAIVDPPYGLGMHKAQGTTKAKPKKWCGGDWDNETPTTEYWNELFRVSHGIAGNDLYWRRSGLLPKKLIRSTTTELTTNVHTKH